MTSTDEDSPSSGMLLPGDEILQVMLLHTYICIGVGRGAAGTAHFFPRKILTKAMTQ